MTKVLVVDDDEGLACLVKKMIEKIGIYSVKTAVNAEEGYKVFLYFKPDIILTDIQMPAKNGLEMIKDIRKHDPGIKTIYMSGDMSPFQTRLEEETTRYKANLLNKPFSYARLAKLFHEYNKERKGDDKR
ncbi:MAG: response regulator [Desulfobacterales bacterium]|nr:response regulator [Desulfobacterales bacterium]